MVSPCSSLEWKPCGRRMCCFGACCFMVLLVATQALKPVPAERCPPGGLFEPLRAPDTHVFFCSAEDQCKEVGEDIIQAILHTDVTKHNETMEDLLLYQMNKETLNIKEIAEEAGGLLKASRTMINAHWDANNSCKPWEVAQLAYSCMDDFSQGDKKDIGIPLGFLNDREKVYRLLKYPLFVVFMVTALIF
ncbi:unnamed protein product, partial [Effrenium voratum]